MPENDRYASDPKHATLGDAFFDAVEPAAFPEHRIRYRNDRAAASVGLDALTDDEWVAHFGRFEPLPDNLPKPLALRYHGHQLRHYNPYIFDVLGFLFSHFREFETGRLLDLATKGSGQTPYSRDGDGRLTLKGGVREVLATELLTALGVNTSKSFSLIETGENLHRHDEPSPTRSSVLVRLGHSHVRFGSFQRLAFRGESENVKRLIDYTIETYWPEAATDGDPVASLFRHVTVAVAQQAAEWFAAGFVHGVLNTDNTVVTGESFDYGPWRFLPEFEPGFTAAYFDQTGLYAFARQPGALHWNLQRLADCLLPFTTEDALVEALNLFNAAFEFRLTQMTLSRLGCDPVVALRPEAFACVQAFYTALNQTELPFEQTFFDLFGGARDTARRTQSPSADELANAQWSAVITALQALPVHPNLQTGETDRRAKNGQPVTMLIDDVERIWAPIAEHDDWSAFEKKLKAIRAFGQLMKPLYAPRASAAETMAQVFETAEANDGQAEA